MLAILAALTLGAAVMSMTMWFMRFGSAAVITGERLQRLKTPDQPTSGLASIFALRRKAGGIRFGGISLVGPKLVQRWATDLEQAGLTLKVREFFILRCIVALVLSLVGLLFAPIPALGIVGAPLGYFIVGFWVRWKRGQRIRKLESQLVDMLQMVSSGLRAGFGLLQALEAAATQLPAPISVELRRTMRDTAMGSSVETALTALNARIGSNDWDIVITAILIQRTVGGNLAEILDNVANTMRERERIKGEIRTLTSQQRLTGYVIGGIPWVLLLVFMMINPTFTSLLFKESLGRMMLVGGAVMWAVGFMVIRKIVNIEV
jgi:tight adherence protein B